MRVLKALLCALTLGAVVLSAGCIKDQQAARTRLPGVDKPPDPHEPEGRPPPQEKPEEKKPEEKKPDEGKLEEEKLEEGSAKEKPPAGG